MSAQDLIWCAHPSLSPDVPVLDMSKSKVSQDDQNQHTGYKMSSMRQRAKTHTACSLYSSRYLLRTKAAAPLHESMAALAWPRVHGSIPRLAYGAGA